MNTIPTDWFSRGESSSGDIFELKYNGDGQIAVIESKSERLSFQYDEFAKPKEVTSKNGNAVTFIYNEYGGIQDVNSPQGNRVALEIVEVIQECLNLFEPVDISLILIFDGKGLR